MKISFRTARIATATFLVGAFVVGGRVTSTNARGVSKPSAPSSVAPRTKNAALPTTLAPTLGRVTTTTKPRVKNGKPKTVTSAAPKGS